MGRFPRSYKSANITFGAAHPKRLAAASGPVAHAHKTSRHPTARGGVGNHPFFPASLRRTASCTPVYRPTQTPPDLPRARACSPCRLRGGCRCQGPQPNAATWLRMLAGQRASHVEAAMRAAARAAWVAHWSGLPDVATSLPELPLAGDCNVAGEAPDLHEVLAEVRRQLRVAGSRKERCQCPGKSASVRPGWH